MKRFLLFSTLGILLLLPQCEIEKEEDLYYEPLVEGIYNIKVDQEQALDFTIKPHESVKVEGEFSNGITFTVEFDARSLDRNQSVEARVQPVSGVLDMTDDFEYNFGFVFSPEGFEFTKPGKMTVDLPPGLDINNFKGFYFQGGVPYEGSEAEIWSVKLVPIRYQSEGSKKQVVFELPHFSGFLGVSGGDFECGNPVAAEACDELKEILACFTAGKEKLTSEDRGKVNQALKKWIDGGLDWLEEHPEELENMWDVQDAIKELACWKSAVQFYNSDMSSFEEQLNRIGDLFTGVLVDMLINLNEECVSMDDLYARYGSFEINFFFLNLMDELRKAGFLNEDPGITVHSFCNEIATNFYLRPFLDTTLTSIQLVRGNYLLSFGPGEDYPARSRSFTVYASNLLEETVELEYGVDYTIENINNHRHILEDNIITEEVQTCYRADEFGNACCPYPCYGWGYFYFDIVLTSSGDRISVKAGRSMLIGF